MKFVGSFVKAYAISKRKNKSPPGPPRLAVLAQLAVLAGLVQSRTVLTRWSSLCLHWDALRVAPETQDGLCTCAPEGLERLPRGVRFWDSRMYFRNNGGGRHRV